MAATERTFVTRIHTEPAEARRDISAPDWNTVSSLLETLGRGTTRRLELHGSDSSTVLTLEGHGDAFHLSVQVYEVEYYCLLQTPSLVGQIRELGPFAFNASEVCTNRAAMSEIIHGFWERGERLGEWTHVDATDCLSPLNDTMEKASAEIGAMVQALEAGQFGGDATLRVQGNWNATHATKADMKFMARKLHLSRLAVTDADGTFYSFQGVELLPVRQGGKAWRPLQGSERLM